MYSCEKEAFEFIQDRLSRYGVVKLFGSAKKGKAFQRGHDLDAGLITSFKSKDLLIAGISLLFDEWNAGPEKPLPLHIIVIGNFIPEMVRVKKDLIQFIPRHLRWYYFVMIIAYKKYLKLIGRAP